MNISGYFTISKCGHLCCGSDGIGVDELCAMDAVTHGYASPILLISGPYVHDIRFRIKWKQDGTLWTHGSVYSHVHQSTLWLLVFFTLAVVCVREICILSKPRNIHGLFCIARMLLDFGLSIAGLVLIGLQLLIGLWTTVTFMSNNA